MVNLLIATTNPAKLDRWRRLLSSFSDLHLLSLQDLGITQDVEEPYLTIEENARHKAGVYGKLSGENVLAIDEGLWLDFLSEDRQPGVHTNRIFDKEIKASDADILQYVLDAIHGIDNPTGRWRYALCVSKTDGQILECVVERPLRFLKKPRIQFLSGYPLTGITLYEESGEKTYAELTEDERGRVDEVPFGHFVVNAFHFLKENKR